MKSIYYLQNCPVIKKLSQSASPSYAVYNVRVIHITIEPGSSVTLSPQSTICNMYLSACTKSLPLLLFLLPSN